MGIEEVQALAQKVEELLGHYKDFQKRIKELESLLVNKDEEILRLRDKIGSLTTERQEVSEKISTMISMIDSLDNLESDGNTNGNTDQAVLLSDENNTVA